MNYWLTIHWPPPKFEPYTKESYWVYLQEGKQQSGTCVKVGDLIFIYETETGPKIKSKNPRIIGKKGIIALAKAISTLERTSQRPTEYEDDTIRHWTWQIKAQLVKKCYIPRKKVCGVLGYKPKYNFRGYKRRGDGLGKISITQFNALKVIARI